MTYLLMSIPFLAVAVVVFLVGAARARRQGDGRQYVASWGIATAVLLGLTVVFDNVMIGAGLFDFGEHGITGIRLGLMPIEDLLYPIAGALLLAGVWQLLGAERPEPGHLEPERADG